MFLDSSMHIIYTYFYANYIVFFLVFRSVSPGSNSVKRRRRKRRSLTEVQFNVVAKSHKPDSLSSTAKVILYVNEETLPIAASTENSGKEPKRIQGFTKSRILRKNEFKVKSGYLYILIFRRNPGYLWQCHEQYFYFLQHKVHL